MKQKQFLIGLVMSVSISALCSADILTVDDHGPADYNDIQDAINPADFNESGRMDFADYSFITHAWLSQP